ncbi:MAG: sugar phosphate isomerase/epimerase [Acholeplasmataceae bacterium]|nr:sugar phosphate isomerase/epimerase [Acholeplasmataceae bacterium]
MKLGLLSAILPDSSFEDVINIAHENHYQAVEIACWPQSSGERRYAGITHINVDSLNDTQVEYILDYAKSHSIEIMALGYYPNPMDDDLNRRKEVINHLYKVINAASKLNINRVSTFIGRNQFKNDEENIVLFKEIWTPIIKYAEEHHVYIGIENCPMYFTKDEWPSGKNLAYSPAIWRKMFEIIPSKYFGLSYDPSHFVLQGMDYLLPLKEFKDKIFHIHLKDLIVYQDKINDFGRFTYPLNYMSPKIPGKGMIDWKIFIEEVVKSGYDQCLCVEIEDKTYEDSFENILKAIKESYKNTSKFLP